MLRADIGSHAMADLAMARDCMRHESMFFRRPSTNTAVPGQFTLVPSARMRDLLQQDYQAMAVMIFGEVPDFDTIMSSIATLEAAVNA